MIDSNIPSGKTYCSVLNMWGILTSVGEINDLKIGIKFVELDRTTKCRYSLTSRSTFLPKYLSSLTQTTLYIIPSIIFIKNRSFILLVV